MYRARLSGSIVVDGNQYRYNAGDIIKAGKGQLPEDRFEWIQREPEADEPKEVKPVPKKRGRKKNA